MSEQESMQAQTNSAAMLIAQAAAMSAVNEQLKSIAEGNQRTERTLGRLDEMNRTLVELKVIAENNKATFTRLFDRLEKVEASIEREDASDSTMRVAIALKADASAVTTVDGKVDGWINQFKGAAMVASIGIALVQACLLGGVAYVITHLQTGETSIALLGQRIEQIEHFEHIPSARSNDHE
jgi:uncharacterized coiled-coil protein SlyX